MFKKHKAIKIIFLILAIYLLSIIIYYFIPTSSAPFNKFMPCQTLNEFSCQTRGECSWHGVPVPPFKDNESCYHKNDQAMY